MVARKRRSSVNKNNTEKINKGNYASLLNEVFWGTQSSDLVWGSALNSRLGWACGRIQLSMTPGTTGSFYVDVLGFSKC